MSSPNKISLSKTRWGKYVRRSVKVIPFAFENVAYILTESLNNCIKKTQDKYSYWQTHPQAVLSVDKTHWVLSAAHHFVHALTSKNYPRKLLRHLKTQMV